MAVFRTLFQRKGQVLRKQCAHKTNLQGDSGGPLFQKGDQNKRTLRGVASTIDVPCGQETDIGKVTLSQISVYLMQKLCVISDRDAVP